MAEKCLLSPIKETCLIGKTVGEAVKILKEFTESMVYLLEDDNFDEIRFCNDEKKLSKVVARVYKYNGFDGYVLVADRMNNGSQS